MPSTNISETLAVVEQTRENLMEFIIKKHRKRADIIAALLNADTKMRMRESHSDVFQLTTSHSSIPQENTTLEISDIEFCFGISEPRSIDKA